MKSVRGLINKKKDGVLNQDTRNREWRRSIHIYVIKMAITD